MKHRWYTTEQTKQMACPLSVGQAEAGRYTFCVNETCMAWLWLTDDKRVGVKADDPVPEGFVVASEPYKKGKTLMHDIMRKPTHGRCGMLPMLQALQQETQS